MKPKSLRATDVQKIDEDIALTKRTLKLLRKVRDALLDHNRFMRDLGKLAPDRESVKRDNRETAS